MKEPSGIRIGDRARTDNCAAANAAAYAAAAGAAEHITTSEAISSCAAFACEHSTGFASISRTRFLFSIFAIFVITWEIKRIECLVAIPKLIDNSLDLGSCIRSHSQGALADDIDLVRSGINRRLDDCSYRLGIRGGSLKSRLDDLTCTIGTRSNLLRDDLQGR